MRHAVVTGNLAGTWKFKTIVLKRVSAKSIRFLCLVGLFNKRVYPQNWDANLDFGTCSNRPIPWREPASTTRNKRAKFMEETWADCRMTGKAGKDRFHSFIDSPLIFLKRQKWSQHEDLHNISSLMDSVSAARRLPNHFHTTKKILSLAFALQRYRDKPSQKSLLHTNSEIIWSVRKCWCPSTLAMATRH